MRAALPALALLLAGCASTVSLVKGVEPVISGTLDGGPWLVEDINGGGVIDNARLDISFADGTMSGRSGCNRFTGSFKQDGDRFSTGPVAVTRMACPPALMDMERKFLGTLAAATMVTFDATGAAVLKAADGRRIKIRRESPQPPIASLG